MLNELLWKYIRKTHYIDFENFLATYWIAKMYFLF